MNEREANPNPFVPNRRTIAVGADNDRYIAFIRSLSKKKDYTVDEALFG